MSQKCIEKVAEAATTETSSEETGGLMGRSCSVCNHPQSDEINKLLLAGIPYRNISEQFSLSLAAISRHKDSHLASDVEDIYGAMQAARVQALEEVRQHEIDDIKAHAAEGMAGRMNAAITYVDQLKEIRTKAASLLDRAEEAEDLRAAGTFLRELREQIRLWAELEGRISNQPQVTIVNNPEWIELRYKITEALDPFPQAKEAVVLAIRGCGRGHE